MLTAIEIKKWLDGVIERRGPAARISVDSDSPTLVVTEAYNVMVQSDELINEGLSAEDELEVGGVDDPEDSAYFGDDDDEEQDVRQGHHVH